MKYRKYFLFVGFVVTIIVSKLIVYYTDQSSHRKYLLHSSIEVLGNLQHAALQEVEAQLSESNPSVNKAIDFDGSIRVYDNGSLIYWNDNQHLPEYSQIRQADTIYTVESQGNLYLVSRSYTRYNETGLVEYYALTKLKSHYAIRNEFLVSEWSPDFTHGVAIALDGDGWPVRYQDVELFRVRFLDQEGSIDHLSGLRVFIFLIAIFLLYGFLTLIRKREKGSIIVSLILLRIVQLVWFGKFSLFDSLLSDPLIYYQNLLFPSLEDLTINVILIIHLVQWMGSLTLESKYVIKAKKNGLAKRSVLLMLTVFLAVLSFQLYFELIWGLLNNSEVTIDISENLTLTGLKVYFLLMLVLGGVAVFYVNHSFFILFKHFTNYWYQMAFGLVGLAGYYWLFPSHAIPIIILGVLIWAVLWVGSLQCSIKEFRYRMLSYLFVVAFGLASIVAYALYEFAEEEIRIEKSKFASSLIIGNDVLGEYYINEVIQKVKNDPFIRSRFINQLLAQSNIRLRILSLMPYYLDKYELTIHTYDDRGAPYGFTESTDLDYWVHQYAIPVNETGYDGVYFQRATSGRNKYITIVPIDFFGKEAGKVVLEFTQKKYTSTAVFPSLLIEKNPFGGSIVFDYAVYDNDDELLYSYGDYPFEGILTGRLPHRIAESDKGIEISGNHFMGFELDGGRQLIVASKLYPWVYLFANVGFYFLLFVVGVSIVYAIYRYLLPSGGAFSLSSKIQFYIGLSFIFPMMLITIALLQVLNRSYRDEIEKSYEKRARSIAENLVIEVASFIDNSVNRDQFHYELSKAADYSQSDLILYNLNGKMLGTNRSEVFALNLLGKQINPKALSHIKSNQGQLVILDEHIGRLEFKTAYTGIYSIEDGKLLSIISIPFFDFKNHLQRQQIEVFHNLIILIVLIFIIMMLFGHYRLTRIIQPIKTIAQRLNTINYVQEKSSSTLDYHSHDEIGLLVSEYNRMVEKLEASKRELAQIQKETAWKEIARQVAHEIKNPLTPMRLKIQQMLRHFDADSKQHATLDSLLVQVDSLATIADSFSAFAKMPAPQNSRFNLSKLVGHLIALFQSDNVQIISELEDNMHVFADEKLIGQIMNNLLLNAIQSQVKDLKRIKVELFGNDGKVTFSIHDEGEGIPEELRDKIFKPYFSTKEKGSGIGLALAKKGIEQANGTIWFESEEGKGTVFHIVLPLVS